MKKGDTEYQFYLDILKKELVTATGCTEPIAIAYATAVAKEKLGSCPSRIVIHLSGNMIKNAQAVTIPNTNGKKGIEVAVAAGIVAGDSKKGLQVISNISDAQKKEIEQFQARCPIEVKVADSGHLLEIFVEVFSEESSAKVRILDSHTNIVSIEKDGKMLMDEKTKKDKTLAEDNYKDMSIISIIDFANKVEIDDVKDMIDQQIACNTEISKEGLENDYGANIGRTLSSMYPKDHVFNKVITAAAAASDARMGGCNLPVVITAGSGNQGLTTSLPVIEYAKQKNIDKDTLYRALALASLITIHQKQFIGNLSAFCGVVSAGASSAAGIAYLEGGRYAEISHTIVNALGITSGMVCDGAKPSCAAKIAMSVNAGLLGYEMYMQDQQFYRGEGLVAADVEKTIANIGRLGKKGMHETDKEILKMMIEN